MVMVRGMRAPYCVPLICVTVYGFDSYGGLVVVFFWCNMMVSPILYSLSVARLCLSAYFFRSALASVSFCWASW